MIWYSISGELKVRDTKQSHSIVAELEKYKNLEFSVAENEDMTMTVRVSQGMECGYGTGEEIDELVKSLSPFAVGVGHFVTECDGEPEEFWVGKAEDVAKAERDSLIGKARVAVRLLTEEEAESLIKEMQGSDFWR